MMWKRKQRKFRASASFKIWPLPPFPLPAFAFTSLVLTPNGLKENSRSDKSEVYRHLTDGPDHRVDFAKPDIFSSAGDSARLFFFF